MATSALHKPHSDSWNAEGVWMLLRDFSQNIQDAGAYN